MATDNPIKRLAGMRKPGRWYIDALEGVQASSGTGRNDPGWFHPSSLGGDCDAQLAFRFLGAPAVQEISARTQRIFDNGSGRDAFLKRDSTRAGVSLIKKEEDREILILPLRIHGELDDWAENPLTHHRYVVDFKTMHAKEWEELKEVKPAHHIQLHPYMIAKETTEGFVLYENKDNQDWKLMSANFDNKIWESITTRIKRIIERLDQGHVDRNPVSCTRCPFFANGVCSANQIDSLKEKSGLYARV